ncbi:ABC transporter ATP-binding protein [Pseudonocardia xinjiangensis]|uniref:ABC transporter ATP-binding protein n=1 Tax=Pseudonocardia xinjiangensis TaxID=75289 RepID=A0ABX1R6P0_9PSEU|nr:ABC transporter ATP-binding protein [Pseudonocardia xinjiangensis]NMH75727.1 ABC transporter ATP-binding protein [Pseudonocardia xinjiangensis]
MAQIDIAGLTKRFDSGAAAVDHLDLTVQDGEFLSLLGPSGCGKTTTLRCVAGLERPTSGEIYFDGEPMVSRGVFVQPEKRHMGMVFQSYALWPHMTAFGNIAYPLRRARLDGTEVAARVAEMLDVVGLAEYGGRLPSKLSGGQQQRVALARALVNRPQVVLYDEPLSNLDSLLRSQMRREVRRLHDALGSTSIYVTHDRTEAMALSDRIAVMQAGVIQQIGTPREIYTCPANRFVADFIGFDNLLKAEVVVSERDGALVRLGGDGPLVRCATDRAHPPGSVVELAARAGAFRLAPAAPEPGQSFRAQVRTVTYLGEDLELQVQAGEIALLARIRDVDVRAVTQGTVPVSGDLVNLSIRPEELVEIGA